MDTKRVTVFSVLAVYTIALVGVLLLLIFEYFKFDAYQNPATTNVISIVAEVLHDKKWFTAFLAIIAGVLGFGGGWLVLTSPHWVKVCVVCSVLLIVLLSLVEFALILSAQGVLQSDVFGPGDVKVFDVAIGVASMANAMTLALLAGVGVRFRESHVHPH